MPREISDIKSFIEICRRKDASCTLTPDTRNCWNWRKERGTSGDMGGCCETGAGRQ